MGDFGSYDPKRAVPTLDQGRAFQSQFDYFNKELAFAVLGVRLPHPMLTFSMRSSAEGFFTPDRWSRHDDERRHEIALHAGQVETCRPADVAATLVHQMIHLWQHECGRPARRGYHNQEWARAMERVGLVPSSTGAPGGKKTGERISHYVTPGGPFQVAFEGMPRDFFLPWSGSGETVGGGPGRGRAKYVCPGCGTSVWGKSGLAIKCLTCDENMVEQI